MDRNEELINTRYDALMFARTPEIARKAAKALIEAVLGEAADGMSLERGLREVCRKIRPASETRDQERFEMEFIELALAPTGLQGVSADQSKAAKERPNQPRHRAAA
jgi:hypothetical protein